MSEMKRRRGRPRKPIADGERRAVTFRLTGTLYNAFMCEADATGRSISEVIERRLEMSRFGAEIIEAIRSEIRHEFRRDDTPIAGEPKSPVVRDWIL